MPESGGIESVECGRIVTGYFDLVSTKLLPPFAPLRLPPLFVEFPPNQSERHVVFVHNRLHRLRVTDDEANNYACKPNTTYPRMVMYGLKKDEA